MKKTRDPKLLRMQFFMKAQMIHFMKQMAVNMKHHTYRFSTLLLFGLLFYQILSISASADQWEFQLAPYAWLAGQNGKVATLPGLPPADVDINFYDDIRGNINLAGNLVAEARKGRFGLFTDILYSDIETEDPLPYGILYSAVDTQTKSWIVSIAGLYRLAEQQNRFLDAIAGVRYWSVDTDLTLKAGLLPERSISNSEDWFDPLIGLKGFTPIGSSRFFVSSAIVIGGFGAGSDFMWDAIVNFGYQWTKGFSTTVGYRYLDVEYEKDDFLYDVVQDGITLGLSWRF
jgi:hypothetical protein